MLFRNIFNGLNPLQQFLMRGFWLALILLQTFGRTRGHLSIVLLSIDHFSLVNGSSNIHIRTNTVSLDKILTFRFCHLSGWPWPALSGRPRPPLHLRASSKLKNVFTTWGFCVYVVNIQRHVLVMFFGICWFVHEKIHWLFAYMLKVYLFGLSCNEVLLFVESDYVVKRKHVCCSNISLLFFLLFLIKPLNFPPKLLNLLFIQAFIIILLWFQIGKMRYISHIESGV